MHDTLPLLAAHRLSRRSAASGSTRCRSTWATAATRAACTATSTPAPTAPRRWTRDTVDAGAAGAARAARRHAGPHRRRARAATRTSATWCAGARALGVRVIDRCNLTILSEPGQEDLAEFLAEQGVEVTASLPCYSPANVDRQRGEGVFERSIAGAAAAQRAGLRPAGSGLVLNLVYNPQGAVAAAAAGAAGGRLQARAGRSTSASASTACSR